MAINKLGTPITPNDVVQKINEIIDDGTANTTYSLSMSGNVITLTGSDGNNSTVTLPVYNGGYV